MKECGFSKTQQLICLHLVKNGGGIPDLNMNCKVRTCSIYNGNCFVLEKTYGSQNRHIILMEHGEKLRIEICLRLVLNRGVSECFIDMKGTGQRFALTNKQRKIRLYTSPWSTMVVILDMSKK